MRDSFHVPDRYFLSHSVGCLPRQTKTAIDQNYFGPWKSGSNWSDWMGEMDQFRSGLAKILSVTQDTICPQSNVSSALTKILYSQKPSLKRNRIVLSRQAFPTIGFVINQAERAGYKMCFIDGDIADPTAWADAIDEQTAFVHITHALSNTSKVLPVQEICELARQSGALSLVDAAQSIGLIPVSPLDWSADFVLGTGVKFLCFGPGACFLYASRDVIEQCEPLDVGWFSHENPFEMQIENFRYAKDAIRFLGGTPSPAPLIAGNMAMSVWNDIGLPKITNSVSERLDILCSAVPDRALLSPRAPKNRGGTCVVNPKTRAPLREALQAEKYLYDEREAGFRFSVHAYTPKKECEALAQIFRNVLEN